MGVRAWCVAVSAPAFLAGACSAVEPDRESTNARSDAVVTVDQRVTGPGGSGFATGVATVGDWALLGAPVTSEGRGSVHVYRFVSGEWEFQDELTASDADPEDAFGTSISVSGAIAWIGAPGDDAAEIGAGAAYVFELSGTTWSESEKLAASDAVESGAFGSAVAVSGSTALITAPGGDGAAYFFERSTQGVWAETKVLGTAFDAIKQGVNSAALDGDVAILANRGVAVFERSGGEWAEIPFPRPSGNGPFVLAVNGDNIVVADPASANGQGQVSPFSKVNSSWSAGEVITASDGAASTYFGQSVALGDRFLLVGSYGKNSYMGGAYLFARNGLSFGEELKLPRPNAGISDFIGRASAIGSRAAIAGGRELAYFYTLLGEDGGDCQEDVDCEHAHCVNGVCCDQACGDEGTCEDGVCRIRTGIECGDGQPCATGFCVDGFCCTSACDGICEACDLVGQEGECLPVLGAPHAGRDECAGFGIECGSACDGRRRDACVFVPANTACGMDSCLEGVALSSVCNGAGACEALPLVSCGQYACGETTCNLSCAKDTDCAVGFACSEGACLPAQPRCSDDKSLALDAQGRVVKSCSPYVCVNAQCTDSCVVSTDCQVGFVCNSSEKTCVLPELSSPDEGGCGCRVPGGSPPRESSALFALAALFAAWRHRRARSRISRG